jgi:hypothetical protein
MLFKIFENAFKIIAVFALYASFQAQAAALPEIVSSARRLASDAFVNLAYYKFQNTPLTNDEVHWLVLYRLDLANDVNNVKHNWNVGNYQQCAWTRVEKAAPIDFSQNQCESVIFSVQQATPILVQMSLIHFGIPEQRSYVMSQVILSIAGMSPSPVPPVVPPNPVLDVFNPAICPGGEISSSELISYFAPGAVKAKPEFKSMMYTRQRTCNISTGCSSWVNQEFNLPAKNRNFEPYFYIGSQGVPTYYFSISVDASSPSDSYCISVENFSELGLSPYYCGQKVGARILTNKCGYSKSYVVTPKSVKGSFVEHELVFYGLLGAPK